jgi:hypothetical protein
LDFSNLSLFEYRGRSHRTVVEMNNKERGLHAIAKKDKAWRQKNNKKAKILRGVDQPLWYIWEAELVDTDSYNKARAIKKASDPEAVLKKTKTSKTGAKGGKPCSSTGGKSK